METVGADLSQMQRTPLTDRHAAASRAAGTDRFTDVEDSEIEVVNPYTDERHLVSTLVSTLGPAQFMAAIAFLNGGAGSMAMRAVSRFAPARSSGSPRQWAKDRS